MSISSRLLPGVPLIESPLFAASISAFNLTAQEIEVAQSLHDRGFAVIDFPDVDIAARIDRIKARLSTTFGMDDADSSASKNPEKFRVQDAWSVDDDIKAIATNAGVLELLSKVYGREAFPFQTLNFPVGTEQHPHTDAVHFSSLPERFMCGVWLALEDMHPDAGPLMYFPGSHKWPIVSNAMIGRRGWQNSDVSAQAPFEAVWRAMVESSEIAPEVFLARKGQALIWAANLLHGGSPQKDPSKTRWSQVTHYYFKDCIYYTPALSDEPLGRFHLRSVANIVSGAVEPNSLLGEEVALPRRSMRRKFGLRKLFSSKVPLSGLPKDFDKAEYYRLNPDVAISGESASQHYLKHGRAEGRKYRVGQK